MPKGGYRQPMNPAPVSGPGALSQRTDGGATEGMTQPQQRYSGMPYGQNKSVNDQQGSAALAGNPFPMADLLSLDAPTARPDEPITTGINMGAGAGVEAMRGLPNRAPSLIDTVKHLTQFDPSGDSELIYRTLLDSGY
jgi:hypothetical protein